MVHRFRDASNTVMPQEKDCCHQAVCHGAEGWENPADRKDIMGFSLATVHAISKTMVHEVELTAKNRSGRKMSPQTIGSHLRFFHFARKP